MRVWSVILGLTLLSAQVALAAAPQTPGYVAVIGKDDAGSIQLVRLTEIERAPRSRGETATRDWGVVLYDAGNRVLWQTHVVNPLNTAGRTVDAGTPIAGLTFANLSSAARAELHDPNGNAVFQINLGAQERSTARNNGEQLRQRMLETTTRTTSLPRSAVSAVDASARASALQQVDFNARQRERLPVCKDVAPVIPEEANLRALTRSPDCTGPSRLLAVEDATRLSAASRAPQPLPEDGSVSADDAVDSESVQTSELDLVNATLVFQGSAGETISTPFSVMRHLSNGKDQVFTVDATGSVTIPVERSKPMVLFVYPPGQWLWGQFHPDPMAQDTDFTLITRLVESVPLDVTLKVATSELPDFDQFVVSIHNNQCCGHFWNENVLVQSSVLKKVFNVPRNEPLFISVLPNRPFLGTPYAEIGPFSGATNISVPIRRGVVLEGRVTSEGALITDGFPSIFMQILDGGRSFSFDGPISAAINGIHRVSIEPITSQVIIQAFQPGYAPSVPVVTTLDQDRVVNFDLEPLNPVTLHAVDAGENPIRFASVRIYRDGKLHSSTRTLFDGKATTALPAGRYEIQLFPDGRTGEDYAFYDSQTFLLFGQPAVSQMLDVPAHASVDTELVANDIFRFSASVPREFDLGCDDSQLLANVELLDDTGVIARSATRSLSNVSGGRYVFDVTSGPGRYKLRVSAVGGVVYESGFFNIAAGLNIALSRASAGNLVVWEGILRRNDGTPIPDVFVVPYDASGEIMAGWCPLSSHSPGSFKVLACDKCTYRFFSRSIDDGLGQTITLDDAAPRHTADVLLDPPLDMRQISSDRVNLVYGQEDAADRYDILVIAEGYTNVRETFVDTNGNGIWDGVQHFDSNNNGVYDGSDRVSMYGSASFPAENTDPTINNEPFTDLNGDGVLSINDEALYQRNVRDYISALFSNDFYNEYRNAFRVHAVLSFSNQVGVDFEGVQQRDTRFGAFGNSARSLGVDFAGVVEYAAAVFPDYDALLVMVNQEIPMWRVNSFVVATGGVLASDLNDLVGAHEFGHQIATLGDEYTELGLEYVGQSLLRGNVTGFSQADVIPWGRHIDIENSIPSKDNFPGTGLFEGANYYETSVYRPSMNSTMRFLSPGVFNVPSRLRLEEAINPFLHGLPGRLSLRQSGTSCGHAAKVDMSWDVTDYGVSNVVVRSGSARGYVVGGGSATGSTRLAVSKAGRDDLFLIDADAGTVIDIESIPRSRPLSCSPAPN
ncbi:MAG: hypothetical protein CVV12_07945 [Gammaproteobacteria bacterium HGW-Gammaproteobacteria-2]|jgi:hypothetical protein|nr:MAG: hypothetical protein CVV12_07945 [Gammaproteobacteria bacterium HGW-Gammaproteobacteria-2]